MMKNVLRVIPACAWLVAAISTSCSRPADHVTTPSGAAGQPVTFPGGDPFSPSDLTVTPMNLPDAPPAYPDSGLTRQQFARFAWRQFIYLNSPAMPSGATGPESLPVVRGAIDPNRSFAASGDSQFFQNGKAGSLLGSNALVWETFAHRSELFPASPPAAASLRLSGDFPNLKPQYISSIRDTNNNSKGTFPVPSSMVRFNNLDETTQIGQNQVFFPAPGQPPSKDDAPILFEAKVNEVEYDYIKSKCNPTSPCSVKNLPQSIELPPNEEGNTKESVEVKSAWRKMTQAMIDSGQYHTAEAVTYLQDAEGHLSTEVSVYGLVGLHILRKMKNYPAFVYTTFEHVDNLNNSGLYYIALYDTMNYQPKFDKPTAIVNTGPSRVQIALPLDGPVTQNDRYPLVPNLPSGFTVPQGFSPPISVVDSQAGTVAVQQVNDELSQVMARTPGFTKSVWQYYRLAGIQILPTNEDTSITGPSNPLTEDFYLANNIIESSRPGIQLFKGAVMDPGPSPDGKNPNDANNAGPAKLINERSTGNILQHPNPHRREAQTMVMGGCMGCHGNAQYPRDVNGKGPSIFNFLITADTLSGNGLHAEAKNEPPEQLRAQGQRYLK